MNHCSEVSHFSYKNTVLLIQLKSSNGFSCRRNAESPGDGNPGPSRWLPKDTCPASHPVHQGSSASHIRPRTNSSNFPSLWRAGSWGETQFSPGPCGHDYLPAPFTRDTSRGSVTGLDSSGSPGSAKLLVSSNLAELPPVGRWAAFGNKAVTLQAGGPARGRWAQSVPGGTSVGRGGQK